MRSILRLSVAALLVAAPAAHARVYDVPEQLGPVLDRVAARTSVPIRVPATLDLDYDGVAYANGFGGRRGWELSLAGSRDCGNATACFLASMTGERGGTPAFRRRVRLARGITGYFKPLSCGGSCSPPMIQWKQEGYLYTIQAKLGVAGRTKQRRAMVRAANEAIRSTPR